MARKRTISPEFFTDEDIADMPPLLRLLFVGMWCQADKAGRMKDKPRTIQAQVLPFDDVDIDASLNELARRGFIFRYTIDGTGYIQIRTWAKHQNPHHTERDSDLPSVVESEQLEQEPLNNGADTVRARSTPNRVPFPCPMSHDPETMTKKPTVARFNKPTVGDVERYCKDKSLGIDARQFVDYYEANGWKVGRNPMKDWQAAVRQWSRRHAEFGKTSKGGGKERTREDLLASILGDEDEK